jgi:uncharacterized caspase-like protein
MAKGIALHIGLNSVDPRQYEGWSGPLTACEADANDMADLARSQGFAAAKLLTKKATRDAVQKAIADAAKHLTSGDIFFLTYSGHGGQAPDLNESPANLLSLPVNVACWRKADISLNWCSHATKA